MIWATVSSWSCFCWLYRASPSLAAKNIINLISVLTIWWCPCVESFSYPMSKVREIQIKQEVLREGIRGQIHWNHNHRKLANLITQTTALSNSMKVNHAMWGHQRQTGHGGEVWHNVVHWRREWKTSILALRTPWTVWKGKMIGYWKRNSPGQ